MNIRIELEIGLGLGIKIYQLGSCAVQVFET